MRDIGAKVERYRDIDLQFAAERARVALQAGEIEVGHAVLLARVNAARQEELFTKHIARHIEEPMDPRDIADEYDAEKQEGALPVATDPRRTRCSVGDLRRAMADTLEPLRFAKWDMDDATLVPTAGSCRACPMRTGSNPGLFEELIPADDRCANAECYAAKTTAWLEAKVRAARSVAPNLVVITKKGSKPLKSFAGASVLRPEKDYTVCRKVGQRGAVPAMVVESDRWDREDQWAELGTLVDVKRVTPETGGTAAKASSKPSSSKEGKWLSWDERKVISAAFGARFAAVVRALLLTATKAPDDRRDQLVLLAAYASDRIGRGHPWEVTNVLRQTITRMFGKANLAAPTVLQLQILALLMLTKMELPDLAKTTDLASLDPATGTFPIPAGLRTVCETCGVDVDAVWAAPIEAAADDIDAEDEGDDEGDDE